MRETYLPLSTPQTLKVGRYIYKDNTINTFEGTVKVIPLLLLVGTFPGFVRNPFDQRQATPCHFSKDFCANPGNVLTNEKKRIKLQKRIVHTHLQTSKAFGVQKLLVLNFRDS